VSIISGLSKVFQFDNFFGVGILLIIAYILLKILISMCQTKKKKKIVKLADQNEKSEEQNTSEENKKTN
jgi:hypothetical protein